MLNNAIKKCIRDINRETPLPSTYASQLALETIDYLQKIVADNPALKEAELPHGQDLQTILSDKQQSTLDKIIRCAHRSLEAKSKDNAPLDSQQLGFIAFKHMLKTMVEGNIASINHVMPLCLATMNDDHYVVILDGLIVCDPFAMECFQLKDLPQLQKIEENLAGASKLYCTPNPVFSIDRHWLCKTRLANTGVVSSGMADDPNSMQSTYKLFPAYSGSLFAPKKMAAEKNQDEAQKPEPKL